MSDPLSVARRAHQGLERKVIAAHDELNKLKADPETTAELIVEAEKRAEEAEATCHADYENLRAAGQDTDEAAMRIASLAVAEYYRDFLASQPPTTTPTDSARDANAYYHRMMTIQNFKSMHGQEPTDSELARMLEESQVAAQEGEGKMVVPGEGGPPVSFAAWQQTAKDGDVALPLGEGVKVPGKGPVMVVAGEGGKPMRLAEWAAKAKTGEFKMQC